jgi:methylase of polypeptide subunit release factors
MTEQRRGLQTAADLLRTLQSGTYTLPHLYQLAEQAGLADRPGGRKVIQDGQEQYKRRVRSALQDLRRQGRGQRVEDGRATWLIEGTPDHPRRALFVWLPADPTQAELVLGSAEQLLRESDEPIDLIVADPPWSLGRGDATSAYRRTYGRDHSKVMSGYVEVDAAEYSDFTAEWVAAAAGALRPSGYLAVFSSPQLAARIQVAAEDVGNLTYVNSIPVLRRFGLYTTRRFVHQHHQITLLCRGPLGASERTFHRPAEMPRGRAGEIYAIDVWGDIPEERRNGLLRYDNALPSLAVSRVVRATTDPGDLVADPFVGSGTTAAVCLREGRRFLGGDINPQSLRFTMARVLAEIVPTLGPRPVQPALFEWTPPAPGPNPPAPASGVRSFPSPHPTGGGAEHEASSASAAAARRGRAR